MGKRHETIGIKQAIRFEWMQKAAYLLLAGLDTQTIRQELHGYLEDRMGSGIRGVRSAEARSFAVGILMNTWVTPDLVLLPMRDALLRYVKLGGDAEKVAHWAMISAAYPFWFNVASQCGRLLSLQDKVMLKQIKARVVEEYGDRQTVSRNVQFVIRSFVYWGVMEESDIPGIYLKASPARIVEHNLVTLLLESALHTSTEGKGALGVLLNSPAFFPFQLPSILGNMVTQHNHRLDVVRYGLDDELLKLKLTSQ